MIKKISPIFLLLLLFSCTNEDLVTPLEKEATTEIVDPLELKTYPVNCKIPCTTPDYVNVTIQGDCSLEINWGYDAEITCGHFIIQIQDHNTGVYTNYQTTTAPFLTPTLFCGDYTVSVSHLTSNCGSVFYSTNFTNNAGCCVDPPSYCTATGLDASCLYSGYIHLAFTGDRWEEVHTLDYHDQGYVDLTNIELNVAPGETIDHTLLGICRCFDPGATVYMKLWIDFDQNFTFDYYELVFSDSQYLSGGSGVPNPDPILNNCQSWQRPGFPFPNIEVCGLRARYILTTDPFIGPCSTFSTGQVVDFTINSQAGC